MDDDIVAARPLSSTQTERLFLLEIRKGMRRPAMMESVTYEGQAFIVCGLVDFGDGHGPVVLALMRND